MSGNALQTVHIEDASTQADLQPWASMGECYQLGRGQTVGYFEHLALGSAQLVRETQHAGVQKLGALPKEVCTISCCHLDPALISHDRFNNISASGSVDTLFFLPGGVEYDIHIPAGARTDYILFDQEEFARGARTLDPGSWELAPDQLAALAGTQQDELLVLMDRWLALAKTPVMTETSMRGRMRQLLLHQLLGVVTAANGDLSPPPVRERANAFQTCRQVRAYVEGRLASGTLPTMVDICAWLGISQRSLQYAFRAYVDMSPLAYLRRCRLNQVRTLLKSANPQSTTVTRVAVDLGFLHLGRFAADYRHLFGESPSRTLAA